MRLISSHIRHQPECDGLLNHCFDFLQKQLLLTKKNFRRIMMLGVQSILKINNSYILRMHLLSIFKYEIKIKNHFHNINFQEISQIINNFPRYIYIYYNIKKFNS